MPELGFVARYTEPVVAVAHNIINTSVGHFLWAPNGPNAVQVCRTLFNVQIGVNFHS